MLETVLFFVSAIIAIVSAFFIFKTNNMIHAMLGFGLVSFAVSLIMLILNLPLVALLQIFIMIGGVSTYLFVGASSETLSKFKHTNLIALIFIALLVAVPLIYKLAPGVSGQAANTLNNSLLQSAITSNIALFYVAGFLLFGVGIGSIIIMKNLVTPK